MGRQRGQCSEAERTLIIHHFKSGKSLREIGKMVNRSHATVQCIITRYKNGQGVENKKKKSQRKIFNSEDERWLVREVKKNPRLSAPKLTAAAEKFLGKKANPETVRIILRKHNFNGRVARNKPYINKINRMKRLSFVKEHATHDFDFWKTVIFADESKFNLFSSDGKITVWRKPNEELKPENLRSTVKHGGGSVMVWGCMSAAGVGNLHFIDGIMNQDVYLNILKENLKSSAEKLGIQDTFKYYQDNDPKHKAYKVRMWLLFNCPKVIETPPQSPDLNVIENLWSQLENGIRNYEISNVNHLRNAIKEVWAKITQSYCEKLVKSMPTRLKAVRNSKGYPTKY